MNQLNIKAASFTLFVLFGLVAIQICAQENKADPAADLTDEQPDEEGELSVEDQLSDLLTDHQDIRYSCNQLKKKLDEAEAAGDEADPKTQSSYDECMADLKKTTDQMKELAEKVYSAKLDDPFSPGEAEIMDGGDDEGEGDGDDELDQNSASQ